MAGRRGNRGGGEFGAPEYRDQARQGLFGRMSDALRGNRGGGNLGFLVNLLGGRGRGGGTGKVADRISAETGENRRTVLRRIQRELRRMDEGKGPGKSPVDKGTGAIDQELRNNSASVMRAAPSVNASVQAWITVSSETRPTQRTARAHLTGAQAEAFAGAIEAGADEEAVNIVFSAYWQADTQAVEIHDFGEIDF